MAKVQLTDEAREDVRDLDGAARKLVLRAMKKLETEPEKRGEPLGNNAGGGNLTGFRKLVVGDRTYRIIYSIERDVVVVIWVIGARADSACYELAVSRLKMYRSDVALAGDLERLITEAWAMTGGE